MPGTTQHDLNDPPSNKHTPPNEAVWFGTARGESGSGGSGPGEGTPGGVGDGGRPSRLGPRGWAAVWVGVNVGLGVLFAYPLLFLGLIGLHVRAMVFGRSDSPFSNNEIQGGEADGAILVGVVLAVVVLVVAGGVNWVLIRRLRLPSVGAKVGIGLVTVGLLVAPALVVF